MPWLVHCGGFYGECDNPNDYRLLALVAGEVYERRDARIHCVDWSPECDTDPAVPGGSETAYEECRCLTQQLSAQDFLVSFEAGGVGKEVALPRGKLTITKATRVATTCAHGNNYVDYAGTFEGEINGRLYRRGVFYALEVE